MKEFLEGLEIGEGKVKLSKDEIKTILVEHGKGITTETEKVEIKLNKDIETYKKNITNLEKQIKEIPSSDDIDKLKKDLENMQTAEAERIAKDKANKEEEILTNNITEIFGDKKFVNDRTKNSLINDIKTELQKEENKGKGIKDVFEALTKDTTDIFANENQITDMAKMGKADVVDGQAKVDVQLNPLFKKF